jgi:methyl-accepting chemotaxis protein
MRIRTRLSVTFGAILLCLMAISITALLLMARMNTDIHEITSHYARNVELSHEMREGAASSALTVYRSFYEQSDAQQADIESAHGQLASVADTFHAIERGVVTTQGHAFVDAVEQARAPYVATLNSVLDKLAAHDIDGARATLVSVVPLRLTLFKAQDDLIAHERSAMDTAVENSMRAYTVARAVVWVVSTAAFVIAIAMGAWLTRSIMQPLQSVVDGADALAEGNLTVRVAVARRDEIGIVAESLNRAVKQLASIVYGVKHASESISSATQQVASGNIDLSQRTEEQAASLEETASSMEQLTATVRQSADNAAHANALAVQSSAIAERGGEAVTRVIAMMHGISDSSAKVSEITNVIEGIAFQTNILALNAAVEAARAGTEGRGFAVVANEVRTLAQRSASAAKEIKELIGESVERVKSGTTLAEDAGSTIQEIVQASRNTTGIMADISTAAQEQRTGIEQVNRAIVQMDQVTQQNAALVEEASAAAQSMAEQAKALQDAVAVFKLGNALQFETPPGAPMRQPARPLSATRAMSRYATPAVTASSGVALAESDWDKF